MVTRTQPLQPVSKSLSFLSSYKEEVDNLQNRIMQDRDCHWSKYYPDLLGLCQEVNALGMKKIAEEDLDPIQNSLNRTHVSLQNQSTDLLLKRIGYFISDTLKKTTPTLLVENADIHKKRKEFIAEIISFKGEVSNKNYEQLRKSRNDLHNLRLTMDARFKAFHDTICAGVPVIAYSSSSFSSSSSSSSSSLALPSPPPNGTPVLPKPFSLDPAKGILTGIIGLFKMNEHMKADAVEATLTDLQRLRTRFFFDLSGKEMSVRERVYFHYKKPIITHLPALQVAIRCTCRELCFIGFRVAVQKKGTSIAEALYMPQFKKLNIYTEYLESKKAVSTGKETEWDDSLSLKALEHLMSNFKKKWETP